MKKLLTVCLVLLTTLCGVLGFAACEEAHTHTHDWGAWVSDGNGGHTRTCKLDSSHVETGECKDFLVSAETTATCTEGGVTTYGCTACGYRYTDNETEKLGHDWVWTFDEATHTHIGVCKRDSTHTTSEACSFDEGVKTDPTCTESGFTLKTCSVCAGSFKDDIVAPLTHTWGAWQPVEGTGLHVRYCTRTNCKEEQDAPCEPTFKEQVLPTCTDNGYDVYECDDCHLKVQKNEVLTSGHNWSVWKFDEEEHKHYQDCAVCEEHNEAQCEFLTEVETKATCTQNGYTTHICPICEGSYQTFDPETQSATGHTYPDSWTMDETSQGSHYHTCLHCDARETKSCEYDASSTAPDCKTKGKTTYTCKYCTYSYTTETEEFGLHSYGAWQKVSGERFHKRVCDVCGNEDKVQCEYTPVTENATCTAAGKTTYTCDTCRGSYEVEIPMLSHDWSATYTHDNEFTQRSRHYRTCQTCGKKDYSDCTMKRVSGVPTCSTPADVTEVCETCLYSKDVGDVAALGHQWGPWTATQVVENGKTVYYHEHSCTRANCEAKVGSKAYSEKQPCAFEASTVNSTCLTAGTTTFTCPHCTNRYTETTGAPLGHDYGREELIPGTQTHKKVCMRPNCDGGDEREVITECDLKVSETIAATCLTGGYTVYTCRTCGGVQHLDVQEALGHDYNGSVWIMGENGTHYRYCTRDKNHRDTVNCSYDAGTPTPPTCTDAGYTTRTCTVCHYQIREEGQRALGHNWVLDDAQPISIDDSTHVMKCTRCSSTDRQSCTYNTQTTPATCTTPARHIHTCSVCAHVYEHDEGVALGHKLSGYYFNKESNTHYRTCTRGGCEFSEEPVACSREVTKTQKATCQTYGYTEYRCSVCGGDSIDDRSDTLGEHVWSRAWAQSLDGQTHYRTCTVCLAKDSKPCNMEVASEEKATCTTGGYVLRRCKTCTRSARETYSKLGHDFGTEINTWISDNAGKHYRECTRCQFREEQNCTMKSVAQAPTCNAAGRKGQKCTVCTYSIGVTDVEKLNHKMGPVQPTNDGRHIQVCENGCGYSLEEECTLVGTEASEATCTVPAGIVKTCSKCGYHIEQITQPALGHSWVLSEQTETTHKATCNRGDCGETASGEHDFTESNLCSICKYDGLIYYDAVTQKPATGTTTSYFVQDDARVNKSKHIVIPANYKGYPVTGISRYAFQNNDFIESVEIPDSVKTIGMYAFSDCDNLKEVKFLGNSELTTLERNTFSNCKKLASVNLPLTVKLIDTQVFFNCSALNKIDLAEDVKIENEAFTGTGLYNDRNNWDVANHALYLQKHLIRVYPDYEGTFEIASGTVTVGAGAFGDCTKVTGVIIPASVKTFDADAFLGCTALTTAEFKGDTKQWLGIVFENDYASPLHYASAFTISGQRGNLTAENAASVTAIPAGTYRNTEITSVDLSGSSITSIGAHAFEDCASLEYIKLPDTLTYIGEDAFKGTAYYKDPKNWKNGLLYIDNHLIAANDEEIAKYNDGAVTLKTSTVTISPNTFYKFQNIRSVNIPKKVKWIGVNAFADSSLKTATFDAECAFFATNRGGAGRGIDSRDFSDPTQAAILLRYYYPNEWREWKK